VWPCSTALEAAIREEFLGFLRHVLAKAANASPMMTELI
jgi:hypothetical protein